MVCARVSLAAVIRVRESKRGEEGESGGAGRRPREPGGGQRGGAAAV